jgi:hypothetical protein
MAVELADQNNPMAERSSSSIQDIQDTLADAASASLDAAEDFYSDWKQFALRKNVFDVTVGLVIGTGLTAICTSLSQDIFMPLVVSSWAGNNIKDLVSSRPNMYTEP